MSARPTLCPNCGQPIVVDVWPSWCEICEWGIVAPGQEEATTRLGRVMQEVAERSGSGEERRIVSAGELRPRLTVSRVFAYAIAVFVHLVTVAFVVLGVLLIVRSARNPFADVAGFMLIVTAILMRPRFSSLDDDAIVVEPGAAPALSRLLDDVAAALEVTPPEIVVVQADWNASIVRVGARRRTAIGIGLPLLVALAPEERVALVAHELGHIRNGDQRRSLVVGTALNGLVELLGLFRPGYGASAFSFHRRGGPTAFNWIAQLFLWVLSLPVLWLLTLELHLLLRDSRRAEYLADARAAEVAGTDAVVSLHEITLLGPAFHAIVARNLYPARRGDSTVFAELADAMATLTPRERERRRRVARLETSRLDATHPPTASRLAVLETRPRHEPRVVLHEGASAAIDEELVRYRATVAERLLDERRDRLYA